MHSEDNPPTHQVRPPTSAGQGEPERVPSSRLPLDDDPTPAAVITAAAVADEPANAGVIPAQRAASAEPPTEPAYQPSAERPYQPLPAGAPYQPVSGLPYQPLAARPRRRWGLVALFVTLAVAVLCVLPVGALGTYLVLSDRGPQSADGAASSTAAPSPGPGASLSVRRTWVREQINSVLARQEAALLAGDERGYLAAVDSNAGDVMAAYTRQYQSLRAMQVVSWRDEIELYEVNEVDGKPGRWRVEVESFACFVTTPCKDGPSQNSTEWQLDNGKVLLVAANAPGGSGSPHPWQVSELYAAAGARTLVVTTAQYAMRLPRMLEQAEQAAVVADLYARPDHRPAHYVIYFAAPSEWKQWFGVRFIEWAGGVAIPVSEERYDLMLNAEGSDFSYLDDLMRHELTHASSLAGKIHKGSQLWWLVEGIAEHGQEHGRKVSAYQDLDAVRKLLRKQPSLGFAVEAPSSTAENLDVAGHYGLAYLSARCLSDAYGTDRLLSFFHAVTHDGQGAAAASVQVFGVDWPKVVTDCNAYVKRAVR